MKHTTRLAGCLFAALALTATAAGAEATISITSPASGATISRSASPEMDVQGLATFDVAQPGSRSLFLRRNGCGQGQDNTTFMSTTAGSDTSGCGNLVNDLNEPMILAGQGPLLVTTYPSADGLPMTLDADRDLTGKIAISSNGAGVGQATVDITVNGTTLAGDAVEVAKISKTYTPAATGASVTSYTADLPPALDNVVLSDISTDVIVRGVAPTHSYIQHGANSFIAFPIMDTGLVQVSSSSTFAAASTRTATVDDRGVFIGTLPTPSAGARRIYARILQNGLKIPSAPVDITVTN